MDRVSYCFRGRSATSFHDRWTTRYRSQRVFCLRVGLLANKVLRNFAAVLGQLYNNRFVQPHVH
jgi:hypothetical protein